MEEVAGWAVIEAPFALFEEEVEVGLRDAVVPCEMPLGLVPEILDAIDVASSGRKGFFRRADLPRAVSCSLALLSALARKSGDAKDKLVRSCHVLLHIVQATT